MKTFSPFGTPETLDFTLFYGFGTYFTYGISANNEVMKTSLVGIVLLISSYMVITTGCKKEQGESRMTVKMVDAPGDFQQVNVEVKQVQVHHEGLGWVSLPTVTGVYDLLTLQNDISATLVDIGTLPSGHITQFRLILGTNNTVMVDDVYYPLSTPSAQQSGLKINLDANFEPNELYEVMIDFDAQNSIIKKGNGIYSLKPVIKLMTIQPV